MDEPIDTPEPPSNLPDGLVEEINALNPQELRSLVSYGQARLNHYETPISELIEPGEGEEIIRIEDRDLYTIVVKRLKSQDENGGDPEPHVFIVTIEPDLEGGRHLHWEDIGRVFER